MQNSQEQDCIEINHYVEIIEYFETEHDRSKREIFRDKYLANLMNKLKQDPTFQNIVRNSIVIMNVLIEDSMPPDRFNKIGKSSEDLSKKNAKILKSNLKKSIKVRKKS